jgi:hypothetical protein
MPSVAFNHNWAVTDQEGIDKAVRDIWVLEEVSGDLWKQC